MGKKANKWVNLGLDGQTLELQTENYLHVLHIYFHKSWFLSCKI